MTKQRFDRGLTITLVCLVGLTGCAESGGKAAGNDPDWADQLPEPKSARPIMQAKLAHTERVLQGLAMEDFDLIRLNAHGLAELSRAADWHLHKTVAYERFSEMFRDDAAELMEMADQKKLEGATLAFMQLTMTCVKCHSYMRSEGLAHYGPSVGELVNAE